MKKWRLLCVHDASAATKDRNYAHEGVLILLLPDYLSSDVYGHTIRGDHIDLSLFGGIAHILRAQGSKAKRISYSTSHGETLAAVNGMESAGLVALRLGEIMTEAKKPTVQQLAALQERGAPYLPVDCATDCRDFFELTTGSKALPQDKGQRIYILAHREARIVGRLRRTFLIPTESMTADPLTKPMVSNPKTAAPHKWHRYLQERG